MVENETKKLGKDVKGTIELEIIVIFFWYREITKNLKEKKRN